MKKTLLLLLLTQTLFAQSITIGVSANVSYAIEELKDEFYKTHPNIKVKTVLASSGKLSAQITHGAPYGIFMSANMFYPQTLYKNKLAITKPKVYAQGALALLSVKKHDFTKGIHLLESENIKRIAIANPKTAPYGKVSIDMLKQAKLYKKVKSKLVYGESISQTILYTLQASDIGIIAASALYSSKMSYLKENVHWKSIDTRLYEPIKQGIVLLKYSKNSDEYRAFYTFILSQKAKIIFKKYGYII